MAGKTEQGVVKSFDTERGQGEIETEKGELLPVYRSSLRDEALSGIFPGDIVEYIRGRNRYGRNVALEVRRIGWEEDDGEDSGEGREWTF